MVIRGFAMVNGVSFTDGKHRVTGRILSDGAWDIRMGGRWYWRFSPLQRIAILAIIGLELLSYQAVGSNLGDLLGVLEAIVLIVCVGRMPKAHRRFHGAEHMAVNVMEGKTVSILHPGCGSNLVLLLLPGALTIFLPWSPYLLLGLEVVYAVVVIRWVWPTLYRGIKNDKLWARKWWSISQKWQRLFVSEPRLQEFQLANEVLKRLLQMRSDT